MTKVMLVDDDASMQVLIEQIVRRGGYDFCCAGNGADGLEMLRAERPDFLILDVMLPDINGFEICEIIRGEGREVPIMFLTAKGDIVDKSIGFKAGADDYLVKPFNVGILRATIANLLQNRRLLRNKYASLAINDEKPETPCNNCTDDLDWKFITTVTRYVEDNIEKSEFNVDSLCALMNMSRTSFYNKLKALTDQAPADYIRIIRLKRAAQLLREKQYNITEISEMTGFNDVKYFREVFKKYYKVSPSQYAKGGDEPSNEKDIERQQ